jgi:hypothetical protein
MAQGYHTAEAVIRPKFALPFDLVKVAATVAVALLGIVALFQVALALGAPLGGVAWGGRHDGVLPTRLRIASAAAALVAYPLAAVAVLDSSGLVDVGLVPGDGRIVMWLLVGLFTFGTVANLASRSKPERYWALVSMGIAISCAVVAAGL